MLQWCFHCRRRICNFQCTNDTTLIALDEEEMAELDNMVEITREKLGLRINASKINVMVLDWGQKYGAESL